MKACLLRATSDIRTNPLVYTEVPDPKPGRGEVLVRVKTCGVCRTDLHVIEGELAPRKSPVIPGHQIVGEIAGLGEDARRFRPGTRVGIPWLHQADGSCEYCRAGMKISATTFPLPATRSMAASLNTRLLPKISFIRFQKAFPMSKQRRCSALESSAFAVCVLPA